MGDGRAWSAHGSPAPPSAGWGGRPVSLPQASALRQCPHAQDAVTREAARGSSTPSPAGSLVIQTREQHHGRGAGDTTPTPPPPLKQQPGAGRPAPQTQVEPPGPLPLSRLLCSWADPLQPPQPQGLPARSGPPSPPSSVFQGAQRSAACASWHPIQTPFRAWASRVLRQPLLTALGHLKHKS